MAHEAKRLGPPYNCQSTNRHYQLPIVLQPAFIRVCSLGPAQLLLWQRTPDLQLTSRKPPGKQLVETKHDKAISAPNKKNAEPSQNVTNLELQSSTHTPPVLHDVESSGLLLFPFCLCFGTLCCLSGSFPRLPLHA